MSATNLAKRFVGYGISAALPQSEYARCVFLIGHMRCGSTALSNIICSHDAFSGYGEAHISYKDKSGPGQLIANQMRRGVYKLSSSYLYDKVLHNRLDIGAPEQFFLSKALLVTRHPSKTIPSILNLFDKINSSEYSTFEDAATYYIQRLDQMSNLYASFDKSNVHVLKYEDLVQHPEQHLERISGFLGLGENPLRNFYSPNNLVKKSGVGDPLNAHKHHSIVAAGAPIISDDWYNEENKDLAHAALAAYQRFIQLTQ